MAEDLTEAKAPASPPAPGIARPKLPTNPLHHTLPIDRPPYRRLNAYAFDPSLSIQLENVALNRVTLKVPWEFDPESKQDMLRPGPVGEYLAVVDVDPASQCFYSPVDLNAPYLLARDGLPPAEGNPQFHQQMVYAVAMTTIGNFERALGRRALWSPRELDPLPDGTPQYEYVRRLRVYPHALREANAYYSPAKKALLFGYFPATVSDVRAHLPGGMVFCCLSHDVVAHETTHALLDGMHRFFIEPSNVDALAFHEAFADICALFQHFSLPEVLRQQIAKTRGDLGTENLLGQLAQEFGQATGLHGSLRDSLGKVNPQTGKWERAQPDPMAVQRVTEPHERGAILVAAVFQAFLSIYSARSADLMRIASGGTGVLPEGALHPDLVNRLAVEASKAAGHVLNMCIRALDYAPPMDITYGDYLRALITADYDLIHDDDLGYRIAVIEAFRQYGIYPRDVRSLSADSLLWHAPVNEQRNAPVLPVIREMRALADRQGHTTNRQALYEQQQAACGHVHEVISRLSDKMARELGLNPRRFVHGGQPAFDVPVTRIARRVGPDGQVLNDVIVQVTQQRPAYFRREDQQQADQPSQVESISPAKRPDFWFRGGATLVVDMDSGRIRYAISKDVSNDNRLSRERSYRSSTTGSSLRAMYFGGLSSETREPFALLHRMAG